MEKAVVTTQGSFQTVQLPPGFHIHGNEVYVKRIGKSVLLVSEEADLWDLMEQSLQVFTDDFMSERNQPPQQQGAELSV